MAPVQDPFFKPIGSLAEQADQLPDEPEEGAAPNNTTDGVAQPKADADDDERPLQEIESLCMVCEKQGVTRMMLTSIPYFREVIIMSFRCEHCGNTNNEVQAAGEIRAQGTAYTAKILDRKDLNRQLVKSAYCTVVIPEFELTIPAQKGQLTTAEGLIRDTILDLRRDQPLRRIQDEETWRKIEELLSKLKGVVGFLDEDENEDSEDDSKTGPVVKQVLDEDAPMTPFTIKMDDPTGNSWIEFYGSMADPKWNTRTYNRTREQNIELSLVAPDEEGGPERTNERVLSNAGELEAALAGVKRGDTTVTKEGEDADGEVAGPNDEIYVFPGICSSCSAPLNTMMKKVVIPYFKDILIMSTNCEHCGYRDNEVKSGGAISEKGKRITLKVEDADDLARDILKSETCGLEIPEIELLLHPGTLGGRFTTLEGILSQVYEELNEKAFARGDSGDAVEGRKGFQTFLGKLKEVMTAAHPFTLILDDPLANSYLQNIYAPDPDPNMETVVYDRTWDQNEELGLNDMKVENYGPDEVEAVGEVV